MRERVHPLIHLYTKPLERKDRISAR